MTPPEVVTLKKRGPRKQFISEAAKQHIKERTQEGPPADRTLPPACGPLSVIQGAKNALGRRLEERHGAFWLDGKVVSIGEMLREANAVLRAQRKPLLGKDHGRWGQ